jgi:hypothetical protein
MGFGNRVGVFFVARKRDLIWLMKAQRRGNPNVPICKDRHGNEVTEKALRGISFARNNNTGADITGS